MADFYYQYFRYSAVRVVREEIFFKFRLKTQPYTTNTSVNR